jgi:hypothetical protein
MRMKVNAGTAQQLVILSERSESKDLRFCLPQSINPDNPECGWF